jgi:hypothetical protein
MPQQPDDLEPTVTMTVPAWMVPHVEKLNALLREVGEMPRGGDLEGLIESHLVGLNQQCYDTALGRREPAVAQQASEKPEAFPPSGMSEVPGAAASRAPEAAHDPDAAR